MTTSQKMTVPSSFKVGTPPWNISKMSNEHLLSSTPDGMLKMKYNVGKDGHDSGAQIFCNPFGLLPANEVTLAYDVFFSEDWDFVICGKLPGIGFGLEAGDHASGGDWDMAGKAGSFRIMWQEGTPTSAILKGYLYLGIPGGPKKAYAPQGPEFKKVGNDDDRTGYSVYYKKHPCFKVKKGTWNNISFTVRMNTIGKADGYLRMQVNDVVREIHDIVWRTDERTKIQDVYWVSIFGGEGKKFAPHNPNAYSLYRNIRIGTSAAPIPSNDGFMDWATAAQSSLPAVKLDPLVCCLDKIPKGLLVQVGKAWKGGNVRILSRRFPDRTVFCFDNDFDGFNAPENVKTTKGTVTETLSAFAEKRKGQSVALVHCASAVGATLVTLDRSKMLQEGTVVVFEQAFDCPDWERGALKEFYDFLKATAWKVQWLAKQPKESSAACCLTSK